MDLIKFLINIAQSPPKQTGNKNNTIVFSFFLESNYKMLACCCSSLVHSEQTWLSALRSMLIFVPCQLERSPVFTFWATKVKVTSSYNCKSCSLQCDSSHHQNQQSPSCHKDQHRWSRAELSHEKLPPIKPHMANRCSHAWDELLQLKVWAVALLTEVKGQSVCLIYGY